MADEFKIVASLDIPKSAQAINADIPKLEKQINPIKILAELDITRSLNSIQAQLKTISNQTNTSTIKVNVDASNVKNTIKDINSQVSNSNKSNKLQIFDSKQLEADGRKYFTKTTDIIDRVKKYYQGNGAIKVDITSLETAKGQIQSFTAVVEDSQNVIKKFNYERAKINTGGSKSNYGFVQSDLLSSVDKNAGANLKSTLNFLTRIDEKIMSIQSKSTKQANPLKEGTAYYDNYNKKLSETVAKIEEIKSANKTLSIEQKNEINKMVTELQLYAKEQQKLAYPPMISSTSVEDSVKKAQASLTTLEQKWKNQGILTGEFKTQVANLRAELEKVGNTEGLNKYNTSLKLVQENAKQLFSTQQEISTAITQLNTLQNSPTFTKNVSNPQVTQTKQDINSLITAYQNLATKLQGNVTPAGLETVRTELTQLNARFNDATTTAKRFETELRNDNGAEQLSQKVALLTQRIKAYRQANSKSKKMFGGQYDSMLSQLANPNIDLNTYNALNKQFQKMRQEINAANVAGKNLWQTLKEKAGKFVGWMSLTGIISSIWREMQQMVTNVIELDSAMTNLKKVTDETDATYSRFLKNASSLAKELKMDLSDLVNQTAEWAKKGYSIAESSIASKASGIYSIVGEVDNATAVQDLTTVIKSYNMAVEDSIDIVDRFNNISNKYSVTASDIGTMLSNSISSLSIAGNSLDEAIAMGTTITEITGDASEAGNTLKVLSMRLRGASTEIENAGESTDGMAESTSKLREKILALTNVTGNGGFDIMADADNFKSTYEIMKGISEVWNDISDVNQASLIELIAGKQRGNTVSALLTNMAQANNILNDSMNSSGSAMREYSLYLESIEGKLQGLKTSFESLSNTVINSDLIKSLIDGGTTFLNILEKIIDKFGTIPTLLGSIATVGAIKNVGGLRNTPPYAPLQLCA